MRGLPAALTLAVFLLAAGIARAEPVLDRPVLFEDNDTYYMLIDTRHPQPGNPVNLAGVEWGGAAQMAERLEFKGRKGRLAIIDSAQLDSFLRSKLRPDQHAWFGMRYTCANKRWSYSDDRTVPPTAYTFWHPTRWGAPVIGNRLDCASLYTYLGAYLAMGDANMRPFWALDTSAKKFYQIIIEFPAPEKPASDESAE